MDFLETVNNRVVIFDGAMGTSVQSLDLTAEDFGGEELEGCNEYLVVTRPEIVKSIHRTFFDAGVDVVETDTFGGMASVLGDYGLADRAHELSFKAATLAREVADEYSTPERPRWVAGSMGPGTKLPSLGHISFAEVRDMFAEQALGLIEGGSDLLIIETMMDLLIVKAAMQGGREAMKKAGRDLPMQVQVTIETTGRMLVGSEIGAALTALDPMGADIIGINCATGPSEMTEHLRHLSQHSRVPISVIPNAGMPHIEGKETVYDLTPEQLADWHARFIEDFGVQVIGGCCGTTPGHLKAVVDRCADLVPKTREPLWEPSVASTYSTVPLKQDTSYLIIGERTNANGSKKFRDAMLEGDWDNCLQIARDQIRQGSHVLDLCVDYVGRDGTQDMHEAARRFATQVSAPLVLDSTEPAVLEAGLQHIGGRAILNSANLEDGEEEGSRCDQIFKLAKKYGAAVICLLIDEEGQARDVEWKMRVARRLHDLAINRYGLEPSDLIFDALTFPLSTGDDDLRQDGMATIEAIRQIHAEFPGVSTTLGVSNISFGLKPASRHALNSVFLHECHEAGMTSAIVHASKILPLNRMPEEQRKVCEDLVYDRREFDGAGNCLYDPLLKLLEIFADVSVATEVVEDRSDWSVEELLKQRILDGDRDGLEGDLDKALESHKALEIVNDILLDGMKVVGELFGAGEMQLPFVLQSAETMKKAVAYLEPHMERSDGSTSKGKIVLATVKGDVHDIGKNLVDIIFTNNGYDVHNLGIKVPVSDILAKAEEVGADCIGMSGLLVKSTLIMRDNLEELNQKNMTQIPVLLGGAALTRRYVERDLREVYEGRLFYGKDAFEGLHTMERLMELKRSGETDEVYGIEPEGRIVEPKAAADAGETPNRTRSSEVETDNEVFTPPFLGSKVVRGISLDEIATYINETALFRNQWQYRPEPGEDDAAFKDRIRPTLRDELAKATAAGLLIPQVVYGYYPANADGNDLVIWDSVERTKEIARFSYPRQTKEPFLCVSDFYRPIDSPEVDYAAFHIVTMGAAVSEETAKLFEQDRYSEYMLLHGLGVEMAEALAELWHHRIRDEWGFVNEDDASLQGLFRQRYRGGRFSWGYPACPDLEDNQTVGELLECERIGLEVSEETGFQYQPEQTTSALICHHPRAKYFVAR